MRNTKLIKDPGNDKINEIVNTADTMIPTGRRRQDGCTEARYRSHILKLRRGQGRFTSDQHQRAPLFKVHIRGAVN